MAGFRWTFLSAVLALAAVRSASAGQVVLNDNSTLQGLVTLTGNADAPVSVQSVNEPARSLKFSDIKTAIFDSLADGSAPDVRAAQDFVPWARAEVSETKRPRMAEIKGSAITIKDGADAFGAGGRSQGVAGEDRCFVFQKLEWDGEIVAHVLPGHSSPPISLGLMISEGLEPGAAMVSLTRSSENAALAFLNVRSAPESEDTMVAHSDAVHAEWLKLRRTWDSFKAYASADGENWTLVGECRAEMDDKKGVFIGVMAASGSANMLAQFDSVSLTGRRTAALIPGAADPRLPDVLVRLRSGSVIAGMLQSGLAAKSDVTIKKVGGETLTMPRNAVASAQYAPTSRDDLEKLATATAGALTRDGDFLEGEIKDVKADATTISSVNFGFTTLERRRITTLVFQAPTPEEPHLIEIRLQDGSLLLAKSVAVDHGQLAIDEPALGAMKVSLKDVLSIHHRP